MRKIFYFILFLTLYANSSFAQTNPGNGLSQKDSIELMSQLMSLLDSGNKSSSYILVGVGIGNRLFSIKNNTLNAFQSYNKIICSPSVGYFHKTGLGFSAGANLLDDGKAFGITQYSMSPSFDLAGNKNIDFNISYSHYFVKNKFSEYSSPIQNDFYTSFGYKKTWLQPGIAVGYSTGEYKDARHKDTVIFGIKRHYYDSITNQLKAFSLTLAVGHRFIWYGVLGATDGIAFTPTVMANAGSGKTNIHHNTNAVNLFKFLNKRGKIAKLQQSKFALQSLGLSVDLRYMIGNFSFEPQFYMDYYLPAVDAGTKKLSQVFAFNLGYTF
jgi:hypothetical protein